MNLFTISYPLQADADSIGDLLKKDVWSNIKEFLNLGFHIPAGEKVIHLTIGWLLMLFFGIILTKIVLKLLKKVFTRKMEGEDVLKFNTIFQFVHYVVYLVVILLTFNAAGINVTVLLTASAALFVGLGLALQELFQDVIAGVYIIVDKSILVGDIVEVNGKVGKVFEIKLRTTRAVTRDEKVIIIPNHKFISDITFNYTQNNNIIRELVNVGVAYGSDVQKVTEILESVAAKHPKILNQPKPFVFFENFGESSLDFSINYFTKDGFRDPRIKSELRYAIDAQFRAHNIAIPFPQRDLHLVSSKWSNLTVEEQQPKN